MQKVLISACLLGNKVRYNASCLAISQADFDWLTSHTQLVTLCPEVSAGLPTPRAPAEIQNGQGTDVLQGKALVVGDDGVDVTSEFVKGADNALSVCKQQGIRYAILAEGSPSCGGTNIYDGSFSGVKVEGLGVTAALLTQEGIKVFSQHTISELKAELMQSTYPNCIRKAN